jgi:hypothetical protein
MVLCLLQGVFDIHGVFGSTWRFMSCEGTVYLSAVVTGMEVKGVYWHLRAKLLETQYHILLKSTEINKRTIRTFDSLVLES